MEGLGKVIQVRNMIKAHKIEIFGLLETIHAGIDESLITKFSMYFSFLLVINSRCIWEVMYVNGKNVAPL